MMMLLPHIEDFIADLNAITRLIVYLGTAAPDINVKEMRFLSSKSLTQAFHHDHLQRSHNMLLDFSKMKTSEVSEVYLSLPYRIAFCWSLIFFNWH